MSQKIFQKVSVPSDCFERTLIHPVVGFVSFTSNLESGFGVFESHYCIELKNILKMQSKVSVENIEFSKDDFGWKCILHR